MTLLSDSHFAEVHGEEPVLVPELSHMVFLKSCSSKTLSRFAVKGHCPLLVYTSWKLGKEPLYAKKYWVLLSFDGFVCFKQAAIDF